MQKASEILVPHDVKPAQKTQSAFALGGKGNRYPDRTVEPLWVLPMFMISNPNRQTIAPISHQSKTVV
jgi:hypothetical protein